MLAHLLVWGHEAAAGARPFLPFAPLVGVLALALIEAIALPARLWAKGAWVLAVLACGMLGAAVTIRQQRDAAASAAAEATAAGRQLAALRGLWTEWDAIGRSLPAPAKVPPGASFDTVEEAIAALSVEVAGVKDRIEALKVQAKARSVDAAIAARLADYLRPFGPHRVVVSCAPNDVEAYTYANQLANILRAAGWDALGPELTKNEGGAPSIAIDLYVRDPASPEAAKILVDAFTRFNIPYQSGIASSEAIPDAATAELHVATKP